MPTPAIQTLITDAQQVLNLKSLSEIRATMAAALANANVGTPLNPNLTTQQLWDQFYLIVRQPESDIESIITNQLMKFLFAPPAPGGVGANTQVIFNDGGVLAGDAGMTYNKTTDTLTVLGNVGVGAVPSAWASLYRGIQMRDSYAAIFSDNGNGVCEITSNAYNDGAWKYANAFKAARYQLDGINGQHEWYTAGTGTVGGTITDFATAAMTLNASGNLVFPSGKGIDFSAVTGGTGTATGNVLNDYEEGTWTIGLAFGGASTGITASANQGKYTKVGRQVTVTGYLGLTSKGSATGDAVVTGLPFTISNSTENYSAASLHLTTITFADFPMAYGSIGTTNVTLQEATNAGARSNLTNADFANNSELMLSLTYYV